MYKNYPNLHVLAENSELLLGHSFETAILICKWSGEHLFVDDFYGDPTCGCISPTSEWALVAGEHITVWRKAQGVTQLVAEQLRYVQALRLIDATDVQLLIDPWGTHAAIWRLHLMDLSLRKVRDFPDYQDRAYEEQIDW
ncbi:hypothetical protein GCM10011383_44870 [Hymenobacter cavernae]|uniref:Uncharacterized protein n=1 Tax=Hymenobacter cavernae TaxID=2044852 RepID=A0ABQ1UVZ7_9BACT|nr:hypothetical protein GCM10011383_44870 [Hymenobacter cavernae]